MRSQRVTLRPNEPPADLAPDWTSKMVDRPASRLSALFLVLAFYYLAYRYPLQINSSSTSPTYSDTPPGFQVTKYLILIVLVLILLSQILATSGKIKRRNINPVLILTLGLLAFWPLIQAILFSDIKLIESGIYFLFPLVLLAFGAPRVDHFTISRTIFVFAILAIIVEMIQVALFLSIGRLPALAYAGSYSVRFGSIWDDPNGFGFVIALLVPFSAIYLRGRATRLVFFTASLVLLILTQSVTAVACSFVACLIVWAYHLRKSAGKLLAAVYGVAIIVIGVGSAIWTSGFAETFLIDKSASVSGHLNSFNPLRNLDIPDLLGWAPIVTTTESGFVNMLLGQGIFFVVSYALLLLVVAARGIRRMSEPGAPRSFRAVHAGLAGFSVAVFLGMANLPLEIIFPVNALVAFAAAMSWAMPDSGSSPTSLAGRSE